MRSRAHALFTTAPAAALGCVLLILVAASASAADRMMFPAVENVKDEIIARIRAETVRIDIAAWYLTEHEISINLVNRMNAGVQVRVLGDRGSIFEIDTNTRREFEYLASNRVPIRLRYHPTWFPEIFHWKAGIFVGQGIVEFGSANWTPFELFPQSATNYKDETAFFTDDPALVRAFRTKFDQYWADTTYFLDWNQAYRTETGSNFPTNVPIDRTRLEPDYPMPPDLYWGQGPEFNNPLVAEINGETSLVTLVSYRLTVDDITTALLRKKQAGVPVRLIVEPNEYRNGRWPEFWLTGANVDKLWANGIQIKQRLHQGLTHMKTLVTSSVATNASANFAANWQRDHNYFIRASVKPAIYRALRDRVNAMWNDNAGFTEFVPQPPDAAVLSSPGSGATGLPTTPTLTWERAAWAVSYDVYLGTAASAMNVVARVNAQLVQEPPATYSWTPSTPLQRSTTYYWRVVSRTNATDLRPQLVATSATSSFRTGDTGPQGPPLCAYSISPTAASLPASGGSGSIVVTAGTGCGWTAVSNAGFVTISSGANGSGNGTVGYTVAAATAARTGTLTVANMTFTVSQAGPAQPSPSPSPAPALTLTPSAANMAAVVSSGSLLSATPPQIFALSHTGSGTASWTASADQPWITIAPSSGSGVGTIAVSINAQAAALPPGPATATVTVTSGVATAASASIAMRVFVPGQTSSPAGVVDTPADGQTGVTGSLPVTGWAIDDVGVTRVRLLRNPVAGEAPGALVFIGNAAQVSGARGDIAAYYPSAPMNDQAGWGYLLLTNFLPNGGNGTFTLHAFADDAEGRTALIGTRTITCTNATATAPFGAIDTPGQGEWISGSAYVNFGWVVTPAPKFIPYDGSTIQVYIDGVPVGRPVYNNYRGDIASAFPGLANSNGAVGYFVIDTTRLADGTHTLSWVATDSAGLSAGIGSRFFTVANHAPGASAQTVDARREVVGSIAAIAGATPSDAPVTMTRGFEANAVPDLLAPGWDGVARVRIAPLEPFVVDLRAGDDATTYRGYSLQGELLEHLPVGATLDPGSGRFSWTPALAFRGTHRLLFIRDHAGRHTFVVIDAIVE